MFVDERTKARVVSTMKVFINEYEAITDDFETDDKIKVFKKIFSFLMKRDCAALFTYPNFVETIRDKCFHLLDGDIRTFSFVSPIVHKYFSADQELRARLNKARNHYMRKKRKERKSKKKEVCPHCGGSLHLP
jgi:hypothetical protein